MWYWFRIPSLPSRSLFHQGPFESVFLTRNFKISGRGIVKWSKLSVLVQVIPRAQAYDRWSSKMLMRYVHSTYPLFPVENEQYCDDREKTVEPLNEEKVIMTIKGFGSVPSDYDPLWAVV